MKKVVGLVVAVMAVTGLLAATTANATEGEPHKAFVCKYVGTPSVDETLQTGQNPIDVDFASLEAIPAVGVFFSDAQGRSVVIAIDVGQEEPGVESCPSPEGPPPTPLSAGATFTEATCDTPPAVHLAKTNIEGLGLRPFYDVAGPDFVDGHPVAGGTYTFTALAVVGFILTGDTVFTHTFAAAPTGCGTPPPPPPPPPPGTPTGTATVICDLGARLYRVSGTIDGQAADVVTPATFPGATKGVVEVVVRRGDTSFRTTVTLNGDCGPPATVTPPPVSVTVPVTPPATAKPPAAKPPAVKPKPKPKPKPAKPAKAKPAKPVVHKCVPTKNGTPRVWVKSGPNKGCHAQKPPGPQKLTG